MSDAIVYSREKCEELFKDYVTVKNPTVGGVRVFTSEDDLAKKLGTNIQALRETGEYIVIVGPPEEPKMTYTQ